MYPLCIVQTESFNCVNKIMENKPKNSQSFWGHGVTFWLLLKVFHPYWRVYEICREIAHFSQLECTRFLLKQNIVLKAREPTRPSVLGKITQQIRYFQTSVLV